MKTSAPSNRYQSGSYTVEFAITIAITLFILFAAIETGRLMYTWSALNLVTQRGARIAAVCPVNDENIAKLAVLASDDTGTSRIIPGIGPDNIAISYFDSAGASSTAYQDIAFVTVSISDYTHTMLIPLLPSDAIQNSLVAPSFSTTLPVESLGYSPSSNSRVCFT